MKIPNIKEDDSELMPAFEREFGNMSITAKESWRKLNDKKGIVKKRNYIIFFYALIIPVLLLWYRVLQKLVREIKN